MKKFEYSNNGIRLCNCHNQEMVPYKNSRYNPKKKNQEFYWQCRIKRDAINKKSQQRYKESETIFPSQTYDFKREKRLKKYGLSISDYDNLFQIQDGLCKICSGEPDTKWKVLAVDHNHKNGEVRGLLCSQCNTTLGRLEEYFDVVITYLSNPGYIGSFKDNNDYPCKYNDDPKLWFKAHGLKKYGLTILDYENLSSKQNNLCNICNMQPNGRWKNLHVDHCHETNKVRGLLCMTCNTFLGRFEKFKSNFLNYLNEDK
jgi:hypothetical protein